MGNRVGSAVPHLGLKVFGPATVSSTAARLIAETVQPEYAAWGGITLYADSTNTQTVYIGDDSVTTSNGLPIAAGTAVTLENTAHPKDVYAVTVSGSQTIRIVGS